MSIEKDYVLGTHDAEIARLGLQHRVWRPHVADAWRRGGFTADSTLIDLGCGPGFASLDLAEIVGAGGRVIGVDRSRRFLDVLENAARQRGLSHLETLEMDLDERDLPEIQADGIWSRWVYAFVRDPRRLLERAARALRPGGTMVMYEYMDYRTWRLAPRRDEFEAFVTEVIASWRATGGEPDIGLDLPLWLAELGFELRALTPICEIARPSDFLWQWPRAFVDTGIARLVELGRVSKSQAFEMTRAFQETETTPHAFLVTPTVVEIIAVRR